MKRLVIIVSVLSMVFGLVAFECSSSEMSSAKMYMDDKVKNYAKAKEMLNIELSKNSNNDEAYYLLGKIAFIQLDVPVMMTNFDKSLKISSKFKQDISYCISKSWEDAFNRGIAFYNRAQKLQGDTSKVLYNKALEAFQRATICLPDTMVAYENYVYTALNLQRTDLVEAPLQKLVTVGSKPAYFTLLSRVLLDKGTKAKETNNLEEAKKCFNDAIVNLTKGKNKFPNDQELMETLASAYVISGRSDEAKASFAEGVKAQPNNKVFRYNYGTVLLNAKDYRNAEEQLKKAVEIDPEYLPAMYNLALCYIQWSADVNEKATQSGQAASDYKEKAKMALPILNKYIEKKSDEADVWTLLAQAHTLIGNAKEAEEAFKKADQLKNGK